MKVGWIGLGKLGLPCALVVSQHHSVYGYDVSKRPWDILNGKVPPMQEEGIKPYLDKNLMFNAVTIAGVVQKSDIIFVAVQTPHEPRFGGEIPVPDGERADFEYTWLADACKSVAREAETQEKEVTLVVVSTVLPGTTNRVIRPLLNKWVRLVYSPQFIAMGTTIADFTCPEFVICGTDNNDEVATEAMVDVFAPIHGGMSMFFCDINTAESIKVLYNTFISMKIVWANHVMELCSKTGADCDKVVDALSYADQRVVSSSYMRGGMGDGGACHPRDLIAMSWLEARLDMAVPFFGILAKSREIQSEWLASVVRHYHRQTGLPVAIMGEAYKPGSDLTSGSPALLLAHQLGSLVKFHCDPHTSKGMYVMSKPGPKLYVIATKHQEFIDTQFVPGSVVIDPFGYIPDREGVTVVSVGRN